MYLQVKTLRNFASKWRFSPIKVFLLSTMLVNGGNYLYNLVLGRVLSPAQFAEAGILITLLLVFSFLAMTFQIVATKFAVTFEGEQLVAFENWLSRIGIKMGVVLFAVFVAFSGSIATFFQLPTQSIVVVLALCMPFYFVMSVRRGMLQGREAFVALSASYQMEMWVRFALTMLLVLFLGQSVGLIVSISIVASVLAGYLIMGKPKGLSLSNGEFSGSKVVLNFFFLTAGYECAQVLINYSDILLVKHYFSSEQAGLYTSMALIGRMIYFVTWMVVMILIPRVLNMKKRGEKYQKVFLKYFLIILGFSLFIISASLAFPKEIVLVLFGDAYLAISGLLWMYALATMLFALANLFVYYFLSLDERKPVYIAIAFGLLQVIELMLFHDTMKQMVIVQIINMGTLLLVQLLFFAKASRTS